jgi:hypothetical protein
MYLFARSTRLAPGNNRDAMAWAMNVTQKANQITELEVSLWATVFSPGFGTLAWTAAAEDLSQLEAADDKLNVDDGFVSLVDAGAKYASAEGINDGVLQLVHADVDAAAAQPTYATVVQSVLAPGATARGIEVGVEIAQRAKAVTGRPTSFGVALTGPYGGIEWISVFDSVQDLQQANEALAADASFNELIDSTASEVFVSSATVQTAYRRIG